MKKSIIIIANVFMISCSGNKPLKTQDLQTEKCVQEEISNYYELQRNAANTQAAINNENSKPGSFDAVYNSRFNPLTSFKMIISNLPAELNNMKNDLNGNNAIEKQKTFLKEQEIRDEAIQKCQQKNN